MAGTKAGSLLQAGELSRAAGMLKIAGRVAFSAGQLERLF